MKQYMEVSIIQIGNSKGLRLNKAILDRYKIKDKVELIFEKGQIVLKPIEEPRKGWDKAFKKMHESGEDKLFISDVFEDESFDEWK
ncbi:MAG TPA: AbrB/MazE/SpoVT family DNA-binding domain-containing protein [Cytophagales bacterium]|nr:AbrB/MazE/SpoVT family DNA-binding domain-containing protein [Cytophagales bacterium]